METKPVKVLKKKTGYQLFFQKQYKELLLESPGRSFGDCSKEIGELWKKLTPGEKEKFNQSIEIENQSIEIENQSIEIENQSIEIENQSKNQSKKQSKKQSKNQSINKSIKQSKNQSINQSIEIESQTINQSINQSIKKKENKEEIDYNFRLPPILHPCRLKLNELYEKEFENHKLPLLYVSESKNIVGEFIKLQPNTGKKHKERLPSKSKFSMDSCLEEDEEEAAEAFLEKMEIDDEDNDDVVESRLAEEEDEQKDGEENEEVEEELGSVEGRNDNEDISRSDDDSESDGDSEEDDDVSLIAEFMEDEICI